MGGDWPNRLGDWMASEREGRDDEADARFAAIFARVPRLTPREGFGDRVMLALASHAAAARRPAFSPAAQAVLAAALVSVGAAAALFWSGGIFLLLGTIREALPAATALLGAASSWLAAARHASAVIVPLARAIGLAAASGPVIAVILANLALAFSASFGLKRLLAPQEE